MLGAGQWVEHDIRADLYARLLALPPAFYHRHRTGDLMSRVSNDISTLRALAGFGTVMLIGTTLAFGGALTAMWLIDPWLTLFAMAPFPALVIIAQALHHDVEVRSTAVQEQLGALSAKVQENLTGMPVVRAYTMEAREMAEFERLNAEYLARSMALARIQSVSWPLMGLVSGAGRADRAVARRQGGGGGPHHARRLRGLQRLPDPARLAHHRAGLDAGQHPARPGRHGAGDRGAGRAGA